MCVQFFVVYQLLFGELALRTFISLMIPSWVIALFLLLGH